MKKNQFLKPNLMDPIQWFLKHSTSGGILLIFVTFLALLWANSPMKGYYQSLWEYDFILGLEPFELKKSLLHWINDGMMAIFFFVVGLEIKREFIAGELSTFRRAIFPVFGAIGGMVVPVLVFISFGFAGEMSQGWGIPMATDIAFSLAILGILGKKVPLSLKIFLTALAIVDDLGAVLVIAMFYSNTILWYYLFFALGLLLILFAANYFNVQNLYLYTYIGFIIWLLFLKSGIHPTIAGVLVAFSIPMRPKIHINEFIPKIKEGLKHFSSLPKDDKKFVMSNKQLAAIDHVESLVKKTQSPLQMIEHNLSGVVNYLILPLFALANAGVTILSPGSPLSSGAIFNDLSIAIAVSLIFGKAIGISLFSWLAVKLKLSVKPSNIPWKAFIGLGFIGGIGFTMSLFISSLAFETQELMNQAKIGIFFGSIAAGLVGFYILKSALKKQTA
ncbi:Na+/H+ antiporter NhaA [Marinilabilia sp.]|uniref:Na+/H+ antiporter NhaA n=1 Tax=Marinilabilia sp. TaxID=2021252 RepID=UPI0025BEE856|nr:Na+/H+ antiporter NhaA [Marinilabilia sp.]